MSEASLGKNQICQKIRAPGAPLEKAVVMLEKARLAAIKAYTRHKPDVVEGYEAIRAFEDAASKVEAPNLRIREDSLTVRAKDGYEIPCRTFTPLDISLSLKEGATVEEDWEGTVVFFHGGGWVTGQVDLYADFCKDAALALKRRIVSVDYRLAPESRFPVPAEDCYAVTKAVMEGQVFSDVVPDHVVLMGDSAGGNLAAAVALMARDRGEFSPKTAIFYYPVLNNDYGPSAPFASVAENGHDYILTAEDLQEYLMLYSEHPDDLQCPYLAPWLEGDLTGLPRTLILSAELCPLRDEDEAFAKRLSDPGPPAACYRMRDAMHGYLLYPTSAETTKISLGICRSFLDGEALTQGTDSTWLEILGIA